MSFYLFTMVVMTIIVAFILEAFLFRIQYKQTMNKEDENKTLSINVKLTRDELLLIESTLEGGRGLKDYFLEEFQEDTLEFTGYKRRTKEELQKLMYRSEMDEWMVEAEEE
ncbi:two pore calcium channel protein 1, partial [Eurytemora carolleeae]|uniref:two pore calcium channel protein 1 n=1 Tax=Eurytemora carolleeae TaxID=1294199 RepID=UPI000C76719B